uniref:Uncharacterized protein n=1 Tax=Castor canadensis TaxID=51338 RepID=A0A8C0WCN5_CASCN
MAGDSSAADRNVEIWKIKKTHQARVAHAYNPSYLGGRDQEDQVWSQPGQIVLKTLSKKKKPAQKRAVNCLAVLTAITSVQQRLKLYNKVPPKWHSTTRAIPPAFFALVIFPIGSHVYDLA